MRAADRFFWLTLRRLWPRRKEALVVIRPDAVVRWPGTWIIHQLREAFPFDSALRYLIFDKDKKYGTDVLAVIEHMGIRRKPITPYSPWQNGAAEHDDRTHLGLGKGTPSMRTVT